MKIGRKEIQAILVLLGFVIIGCAYYFGYRPIVAKTAAIENENRTLRAQAEAYEILYTKSATYKQETERMAKEIPPLEANFVYGMTTQDEIMYVTKMEDSYMEENLVVNYINMGQGSSLPYTPAIDVDPAFSSGAISMPTVADDGVMLVEYGIDYGCNVSYQGFKEMVGYLNSIGGKKIIKNISLSFDSSNGLLNGTIGTSFYVLVGTGNQYNPLPIPAVGLGVENIFGTVEIVEEEPEAEPEPEPEPEPQTTTKKKTKK